MRRDHHHSGKVKATWRIMGRGGVRSMLCRNSCELRLGEWHAINVEKLHGVAHIFEQTKVVSDDGACRLVTNAP